MIVSWLSNRKQRIIVTGTASDWAPVTSAVSHDFVLGLAVFMIYINDIDVEVNNFISKFADDTKMDISIVTDHVRMSLQEDLRKISEWSQRWKMPINVNKCHILLLGTRKKNEYQMSGTKLESVQSFKNLCITVVSSL